MKFVLVALLGLLAVAGTVLVMGWLTPRHHTAAVEATYRADAATIYAAINDVASGPAWRTGLEQVDVLSAPGEPLRWRETADWGTLIFVHETNEPERRIVSRIVDEGQGFGGTWTFDIAPATNGTIVRITEHGEVSNPLYRFMSRFVLGYYHGLEIYLRDLGTRLTEQPAVRRVETS